MPVEERTNRCTGVPSAEVACVSTTVTGGTSPATAARSHSESPAGASVVQTYTDGGVA